MPNPQITFPAAFAPAQAVAFSDTDQRAQIVSAANPLPVTITNAASGESGGGATTMADGADVALGAKADAAATSDTGAFSLIALTKRLLGKIGLIDGVSDNKTETASVTSAAVVLSLDTLGYAGGSFHITSIGSGNSVAFEQSNDGATWSSMPVNLPNANANYNIVTATTLGFCNFAITARYVRARVVTYSSGTVTITSCMKRVKANPETIAWAMLQASDTVGSIGMVRNYVGYQDSVAALAAAASFTGTSRSTGLTAGMGYFNARAYADQPGTLYVENSQNSGVSWEIMASAAVAANSVAYLRVGITGASASTNLWRLRYVNGATAQSLFRLSSSLTAA